MVIYTGHESTKIAMASIIKLQQTSNHPCQTPQMGCPIFQKRALAYVRHKLSDEFSSGFPAVQSDTADVVFESSIARTTVPSTIEWSWTSILGGCKVHSKMNGKSLLSLLSVESRCFRRNIGSGLSLPSLEETSNAPN